MSTSLFLHVVEDATPERRALVAQSPSMQQLVQKLPRLAEANGVVLLHGERGTGKERLARELHRLGPAAAGAFVVVAVSRTGAEAASLPVDAARGGMLYVDEVAELGLAAQADLLRALDEGVRVVAATRHDLNAEMEAKRFRTDLGRRLLAVVIEVPPLRSRREDVEPLFTSCFAAARATPALRSSGPAASFLTSRALSVLLEHAWPGNVRELESLARLLAVAVEHGPVDSTDLPPHFFATRAAPSARSGVPPLADVERRHILAVYEHAGRNKRRASDLLGISLRTLYNKLTEYHVHGAAATPPAAAATSPAVPVQGVGNGAVLGLRNGGVVR